MALVQPRSRARHAAADQGLAGLGRGSTPAEGRAESVPEAGGTGADAAATPTTPPPVTTQTHAKSMASTGGDRWSAGEHPATGHMDARPGGSRANSLTAPTNELQDVTGLLVSCPVTPLT